MFGMTAAEFADEPGHKVDWFLEFERMDAEVEAKLAEKAQRAQARR